MKLKSSLDLLIILSLLALGLSFSSCSISQPFYFAKGTGSFNDLYKTDAPKTSSLTATIASENAANDLTTLLQTQVTAAAVENTYESINQKKIIIQRPTRKQVKQLKKRLEAVLDTTKKRERVTIKTNEKKVDELRNEVEDLKNSVKTEKDGDKVVVSFDKPETSLSKEAKILIIVGAALLLIGLLSLPIIGPVLGVVLGIAVVAAALALVLGIVEIG